MTEVKVGIQYSIEEAFRMINADPKILLENSINDWELIQKIIDCLHKCKKDFEFKKQVMIEWVKDAVNEEYIEPLSGGGCDQIHQLAHWYSKRNKYLNIINFRFVALYDSDKVAINSVSPNLPKARGLAKIIKDNGLTRIHILAKRERENYIPEKHVIKALTAINNNINLQALLLNFLLIYWEFLQTTNNNKKRKINNCKICSKSNNNKHL